MLLIYLLWFLFSLHVALECLRIMFYRRTVLVVLLVIFWIFSKFKLNLIPQHDKGRIQTENGSVETLYAPKKMSPKMKKRKG